MTSTLPPPPPLRTSSTATVTLDAVVHDPHMHAVFLKYLSEHDSKNFARLLFLYVSRSLDIVCTVSVDEFKKLVPTDDSSHSPTAQRVNYAKKIIHKYMAADSFFYIGHEERHLLQGGNLSVASFGESLHHDLHLCGGLSANRDLFVDVETAILAAMAPSFCAFSTTSAFQSLVNMEIMVPPIEEVELQHATSSFTLERVLANRRLCCVFWLFLFKERTHGPLSFWMESTYRILPLLESRPNPDLAASCISSPTLQPASCLSSLTHLGRLLQTKYFNHGATAQLHVHGEAPTQLVEAIQAHLAEWSSGNFIHVLSMAKLLRQLLRHVKDTLHMNHFVRFIQSPSFHSMLLSPSRSRLCLSPHKTRPNPPHGNPTSASVLLQDQRLASPSSSSDSSNSSSNDSNSTLQDVVHVMNVHSSHQSPLSLSPSHPSAECIAGVLHFALQASSTMFDTDVLYDSTTSLDQSSQLPEHLDAFFCPGGTPSVVRSQTHPPPSLCHVTIGPTDRPLYMVCLSRYIPITDAAELNPLELVLLEQKNLRRFVLAGICVLSRVPNFETVRRRLRQLHADATADPDSTYATSTQWRPTLAQLSALTAESSVVTELSTHTLFTCLSPKHVLQVLAAVLCERKVLLISSHVSVLTTVGETLRLLLRPLQWPHVFAPVLPACLVDCLHCPTPFVFGVHRTLASTALNVVQDSDSTVMVVDLDADGIECHVKPPPRRRSHAKDPRRYPDTHPDNSRHPDDTPDVLPQAVALEAALRVLVRPEVECSDDVSWTAAPAAFPDADILALFHQTWERMLDSMEEFSFVLADDGDSMVVFDSIGFLQQHRQGDGATLAFYQAFLKTQLFSHYIATHGLLGGLGERYR
ncbi:hypothetical protein B5M09_006567 [Aphanomyces astaci]|uniref:UDENN domain-containing protein n=1 Tax=Aphanomyces astaci TaxID=112090 RepID=A0A3R7WJT8_APHAT|nr:hypothetical protein B5M09_006567 [Aphanomyces astaci]